MNVDKDELIEELRSALHATLEWIDAVPNDVFKSLQNMPGFDRDWADGLLEDKINSDEED